MLNKLDPLVVSEIEAKHFFDRLQDSNNKLLDYINRYVQRSKTVFDVGSNAGYFSKGMLDRGYTGKLCLFEPIPNLISIAVRTLAGYSNQKLFINSALGEKKDIIDIFLPEDSNIGWITFVESKTDSRYKVKVSIESTYEYASIFKPEFVKIDIEGYELFVLRPFLKLISDTYKPVFFVELGWGQTNPHWAEFLDVAEQFRLFGYKFINVSADEPYEMSSYGLQNLNKTIDVIITAID